jgi:MerR family transcriptional regulator, light-induced transcriptional regulator
MMKQDVHVVKLLFVQKLEEREKRSLMVFIRSKKVKGENYLYLVRSIWDSKKSSSRQEIIKYLGNAANVVSEDIPIKFRDDPKVASFLSSNIGKSVKQKEEFMANLQKKVFECLTNGQRDDMIKIYETYIKSSTVEEFLEKIIRPVMYKIGDLWEANKLSVASEHIASNIAHDLIKIIGERISKVDGRGNILVCTPPGEEHNLGCNILESYLQSKRYKVFNLSPNVPSEDVIEFIKDNKPDLVLVSITLEDNIKPGQRFVKKIVEKFDIPVFVGGFALVDKKPKFEGLLVNEDSLSKIYNVVRTELS